MSDQADHQQRPQQDPIEEAVTLARLQVLWQKYGVWVAVVGTIITVIGTAVAVLTSGSDAPPTSPGTVSQGGAINGNGNDNNQIVNNYNTFQNSITEDTTDEQIRSKAKEYTLRPAGAGPFPYLVVDTAELGLKIRSTGGRDGRQIGSAANRSTLWVDCQLDTGFAPNNDGVALWLRVRWPNTLETKEFYNSQVSDTHQGWAFAGYAVPAGHDGTIPACS